jgi:YebC/PmpR family DNA-binding regulatory protein
VIIFIYKPLKERDVLVSGHSKWANIKHKKTKEDARRGKLFTKIARQITLAAREGGGDPNANTQLRIAIENARAVNMPNDNVERAIKRGIGELEGVNYEECIYEGYGPGGVAILVTCMTDNRNRTSSDVRHLFSKYGGSLGEAGCVAWMFELKGIINIAKETHDEDELTLLAIDSGALDVEWEDNSLVVYTSMDSFRQVSTILRENGLKVEKEELVYLPSSYINVDETTAKQLLNLVDALDDHDDVQQVYTNADISDDILANLED